MQSHYLANIFLGMALLAANCRHFHQHIFWKPGHLHRFTRRQNFTKIGFIDGIKFCKIVHVFQKAGAFDHILQRHAGSFDDGRYVF